MILPYKSSPQILNLLVYLKQFISLPLIKKQNFINYYLTPKLSLRFNPGVI